MNGLGTFPAVPGLRLTMAMNPKQDFSMELNDILKRQVNSYLQAEIMNFSD